MKKLSAGLILYAVLSVAESNVGNNFMKAYELPKNPDFSIIKQGNDDYDKCSPKFLKSDFLGIAINTPDTISLKDFEEDLFVCATYAYSDDTVQARNKTYSDTIIFVVVDIDGNIVKSNQFPVMDSFESNLELHELIPGLEPEPKVANPQPSGRSVKGWVNMNLQQVFALPKKPQRLLVYATADNYVSNVREIIIYEKEKTVKSKFIGIDDLDTKDKIKYKISTNNQGESLITGTFELPAEAHNMPLHTQLHKALVLTVSSGYDYRVLRPFEHVITFDDDVKKSDDKIMGSFSVNLSNIITTMSGRKFNVLFSLGPYLSEINTIEIPTAP